MDILTNALKKQLASLSSVKGRRRHGMFVAEGTECVLDTLGHFEAVHLVATEAWLEGHGASSAGLPVMTANRGALGEISTMTLAPDVIAVYRLPEPLPFDPDMLTGLLVPALDCVQDPGNLGTIMRTADWMGIKYILASQDTADCFNPKAIQSTMGAISRVKVIYGSLPDMLGELRRRGMPVYGTFLDGDNIYTAPLSAAGVIVLGNEGRGISNETAKVVDRRLFIPPHPKGRECSESLNVASAASIVMSQFISRIYGQNQI